MDIEAYFKKSWLTYREALNALMQRGLTPRQALDIVGKWNQDVMGGRN